MNRNHIASCAIVFLVTRIYLLFVFQPHNSDVSLYSQYAYEYLLASKQRVSFYLLHRKRIEAEQMEAKRNHSAAKEDEQKIIPYPPLAIQLLRIPSVFIKTDAAWSRQSYVGFEAAYQPVFRRMMFIFDLANLGMIIAFLSISAHGLASRKKSFIALSYILGVFAMPHTLYDRLDIVLGTLLLASTTLLLLKKRPLWSFLALAAAVNFKISPVVLVPLVAFASAAVEAPGASPGFPWKPAALRCAAIAGLTGALFAPFLLLFGKDSVSAFLYQYQRGLHLESFYSAVLMIMSAPFHIPCSVGFGYGAFLLQSPPSRPLAAASGPITLAAVAGVYFVIYKWWSAARAASLKTGRKNAAHDAGQRLNTLLVAGQLLCMTALIVFSKNFSPQYLFWLFPLLFIMDFGKRGALWAAMIFMGACVLTTVIFPYCYFSYIVPNLTPFGKTLLAARGLFLAWFMTQVLFIFTKATGATDRALIKGKPKVA
jgi:hypothetical protein